MTDKQYKYLVMARNIIQSNFGFNPHFNPHWFADFIMKKYEHKLDEWDVYWDTYNELGTLIKMLTVAREEIKDKLYKLNKEQDNDRRA